MILLSVPHTGTRFLASILNHLGVKYHQYHSVPQNYDTLYNFKQGSKAVVPVRDPVLCFVSTLALDLNRNNPKVFKSILNSVVINFNILISKGGGLEEWLNCALIRLDTDNRAEELSRIADHCNVDPAKLSGFEWNPVGVNTGRGTPADYFLYEQMKKTWDDSQIDEMLDKLSPARLHYGFSE